MLVLDFQSSLFLVFASIESKDRIGDFQYSIGLFLVDANTPGVSIASTHETIGFEEKSFKRVTIKFDKVKLAPEQLLSENLQASVDILNQLRLNMAIMAVNGVMKPIINKLSDFFINTRIQNIFYKDLDVMKETVGRLTATCYGLESMIYYTTALKDIYDGQDIDVECGAVKSFAVQVRFVRISCSDYPTVQIIQLFG